MGFSGASRKSFFVMITSANYLIVKEMGARIAHKVIQA